jgi:hypothetical protein
MRPRICYFEFCQVFDRRIELIVEILKFLVCLFLGDAVLIFGGCAVVVVVIFAILLLLELFQYSRVIGVIRKFILKFF